MKLIVEPGKYVVAVSGGVDSVVLLNMLSKQADLELVVAHFDHGIRKSSGEDALFVRSLAKTYGLSCEIGHGELGVDASEALARENRYEFLESVRNKHKAQAIITAHHQDDVIETAFINILRGTKRKGLSSLSSTKTIIRPMLKLTKEEIREYAIANQLEWREDETNDDEKYLRNWLRKRLKTSSTEDKEELIRIIESAEGANIEIDQLLNEIVIPQQHNNMLERSFFDSLSYDVSCEVLARWLRHNNCEMSGKRIHQLVQKLKTMKNMTTLDIDKRWVIVIERDQIRMQHRQSV